MLRIIVPSSCEVSSFQQNFSPPGLPFLVWRQAGIINFEERRWEVVCYITEYSVASLVVVVVVVVVSLLAVVSFFVDTVYADYGTCCNIE